MYESLILGAPHHRAELEKIKKEKMIGFQEIYAAVFKNKVKADPNFDKFLQVCDKISKQVQGQNIDQKCKNDVDGLIALYEEGAVPLLDDFTKLLEKTVEKTNGKFAEKMNEQTGKTESLKASLKKLPRALEKIMLEPGPTKGNARICRDIVRGMIVYEDMHSLSNGLEFIRHHPEWELVRIKNRFLSPTDGGWADCMINIVKKSDPTRHVAEIQLVHEMLYNARSGLNGHRDYHKYRCANELLAILDFYGRAPKTDILVAALQQFAGAQQKFDDAFEKSHGKNEGLSLLERLHTQIQSLKELQFEFGSRKSQIERLESDLLMAMEVENFDEVEKLQLELDIIKSEMKKLSPQEWLESKGIKKISPKERLDAYVAFINKIHQKINKFNQNAVRLDLNEAIRRIEKNDHSPLNLNLSLNGVGAEVAKNLAIALEKNSSLLNLDLSVNEIGDEGAKNLAIALKKNTSLLEMDIRDNNIEDEELRTKIEAALKRNKEGKN
uniref:Uncharacterized protein n=1 Tax=Aureoumbra lagunensis TaxID=44058 RepID=A0A7S3JYH1_9STRA